MIDYNQLINRKQIDTLKYEQKFLVADNLLNSPKPNMETYKDLLNDPTTFAYMMFTLNNQRVKLYPFQDLVLNDQHRFIYFRSSNQLGKSFSLNIKSARNLILDHGHAHNEIIVSKSLPQSTFQMRRVKSLLNNMKTINWEEVKGETDNLTIISYDIKEQKKIKYTNYLICAPCTEGLLGYDAHELNLDEFEFWDTDLKYFYNQIAEPRTFHTKGRILIITNPNGADNYGATLERLALPNQQKKFHTYKFNFLDKPGNTTEELELAKLGKTRAEIESTLLAERGISHKNYFAPNEIRGSMDPKTTTTEMVGKQPFFFLDVGSKHDQSCLTGGHVELREGYDQNKSTELNRPYIHLHIPIIKMYPVNYPLSRVAGSYDQKMDSDGWDYEKSVKEHLEEWGVDGTMPIFGFDVTGNQGMIPLFDSIGINAIDVTFSGPSKSGYYQRFKYMMEKGLIHRPEHEEWENQAKQLEVTKSARGYLLINSGSATTTIARRDTARAKKIPDDAMDSTAGLIHLADNPLYIEPSFKFIETK